MNKKVKYDDYNFVLDYDKRKPKPYIAKCLENGIEQKSYLSHEDAINLIINVIDFANTNKNNKSNDIKYIKNIFEEKLLKQKLSKLNNIVEKEISPYIHGGITAIERDKFDTNQLYYTNKFKIIAKCENGFPIGVTSITVEKLGKEE